MLKRVKREKMCYGSKKSSVVCQFNKTIHYFVIITCLFVIFLMVNTPYVHKEEYMIKFNMTRVEEIVKNVTEIDYGTTTSKKQEMKYILLWTNEKDSPFVYLGKGRSVFITKNCEWTNCYVTGDRNYLGYYTEFDAILFNGPQLTSIIVSNDLPRKRSFHQKYVYANIESASNYPVPNVFWNGFYNWTWTYKLNSDAVWGYIVVRNATNNVIGPSTNMHWIDLIEMDPIDEELKEKLNTKTYAAAWFVSNCYTSSKREDFVRIIQRELKKYNLQIHIYGSCGKHLCPRKIMNRCLKSLQKRYFFYLAFENALSEDYVTEKIVYALNHDTVPIVYGGANYSRFLPPGTYLNAMELGAKKLAKKMNDIIKNPAEYQNFFKWKKYYSFNFRYGSPDSDDYCRFCAMLNDGRLLQATTVYDHFDSWWTTNFTYSFMAEQALPYRDDMT